MSDKHCMFTIRYRTNQPKDRYFLAAAILTGELETKDGLSTYVYAESRMGRVQILLSFSLVLVGVLLLIQPNIMNLLISLILFIMAIFYWRQAVTARDHLANLIQDDLMQVEENLNHIAKLRRGEL